ncbi:AMP-binding protein [Streptomyces sp. MBT67]|uniref:AMP-binding protein n=1 Tax=unclassified Streptomyces TaxID=2593676 RepID=UPI00190AC64C|nr:MULTISPECIES: AMP-binding protein [unclassified Streptomyces]MBK3529155.1 AMP-binding protein [Streptomyces sp. MBT72]MBK3535707.1 AMP-binding protein [Streptomyces sp. MBT67]MBK3548988.1 AMP-binding protein [Streptomyces sp. MBT61]MBK6030993.1 AMP-binding protein [Streptomyces sp. MBT59]
MSAATVTPHEVPHTASQEGAHATPHAASQEGPQETLHGAVARWAARTPAATAVVHGARRLRYAELDRAADARAGSLARRGVVAGDLVPVLLPRGTELIVSVLAVLKLGAAYALLDPAWPDGRIREVTDRLGARLIVTGDPGCERSGLPVWSPAEAASGAPVRVGGEAASGVPAPVGGEVVSGVPAPVGGEAASGAPVPVGGEVSSDAPACVFFTSGTTGRPKGVLSPHRATARLVRPDTFARFGPATVIPLAAALPWDAFSLELWAALLSGGTSLVVDEPYLSGQALREAVAVHGADTVWLTSSLLNMVVDEDPDAFLGLAQVITGGERLSVPHVRAFVRRHPGIALINGYGPVESTVFATTHRITEADCDLPGGIPVGRPVPGTRIHVIDGEICVAGDGLALRYLGEPELTEAKFPRVRVGGEDVRVYRTGDLGRLDENGVLHYGGRADRQVKVRGHRVEPAEVERRIQDLLPAVRDCRVVAHRNAAGNTEGLVAFCVPEQPGDPLSGAAATLAAELVAYQRPDAVLAVAGFPLTAQGKLDERALLDLWAPEAADGTAPAPSAGGAVRRASDEPSSYVHRTAAVFAAVLGLPTVPLDTPFTDLGGSSLAGGRVCARLAAELERPVPVSRLYEHPTARGLGQWLAQEAPVPPAPVAAGDDVPLTPMQTGYLTNHLLRPQDRSAHCLLLFRIDGDLDLDSLDSAVETVHERHETLRTACTATPHPVARVTDLPAPVLEILEPEPDTDRAVETLRATLGAPLGLDEGEVWRTALVPLEPGRAWVFGCVVHHIAFDGWSESVLAGDLAAAYNAARAAAGDAAPVPSPPPALSVVASAGLRAERLAHADPEHQRATLIDALAGVPELTWPARTDPTDAPAAPAFRTERLLDPDAAARLDAAAARAGVTRYAVLLACYGQVLAELTGQRDFAVGVPVAQRFDPRLDDAVGCHIEMACLRLRGAVLDGGPEAVAEAGRVLDRAFAAQDVSFHELVRLLNPPRTGRPPLFQTLLVLQDNAIPELPLTGLGTTLLRPPYLDIPLEVQTEVWPLPDGRLRLAVNHRPDAVGHATAHELAERLAGLVHTLPSHEGDPS